jgi:hypothetical protein
VWTWTLASIQNPHTTTENEMTTTAAATTTATNVATAEAHIR